ncbi:MAG: hypothetical protein NVV74_22970 [Magnetospirillum sp.]|nr:hypothetical protein [Magnetospirillum sp.]
MGMPRFEFRQFRRERLLQLSGEPLQFGHPMPLAGKVALVSVGELGEVVAVDERRPSPPAQPP